MNLSWWHFKTVISWNLPLAQNLHFKPLVRSLNSHLKTLLCSNSYFKSPHKHKFTFQNSSCPKLKFTFPNFSRKLKFTFQNPPVTRANSHFKTSKLKFIFQTSYLLDFTFVHSSLAYDKFWNMNFSLWQFKFTFQNFCKPKFTFQTSFLISANSRFKKLPKLNYTFQNSSVTSTKSHFKTSVRSSNARFKTRLS